MACRCIVRTLNRVEKQACSPSGSTALAGGLPPACLIGVGGVAWRSGLVVPVQRPCRLRSEAYRQPRPSCIRLTFGSGCRWRWKFQLGRRIVADDHLTLEIEPDPVRGGGGEFATFLKCFSSWPGGGKRAEVGGMGRNADRPTPQAGDIPFRLALRDTQIDGKPQQRTMAKERSRAAARAHDEWPGSAPCSSLMRASDSVSTKIVRRHQTASRFVGASSQAGPEV